MWPRRSQSTDQEVKIHISPNIKDDKPQENQEMLTKLTKVSRGWSAGTGGRVRILRG